MIDRRAAVGLIGGGLALAAAPRTAMAAASAGLASPEQRMRAFMLMRGALDDRLVIGCINARYWGSANGAVIPLFDVVAATFARYRQLPDGSYRGVAMEQAYFLDLKTGEWMQTFDNPYTGKTVKVPTAGYPGTAIVFTPDLEMQVPKVPPGAVFNHTSSPFIVHGDDVTMNEVLTMTTATPEGKKPALFHEVTGLHARLSEINRPGAKKVRCETSYTSIKSWRGWLEMADHPGETISTGIGVLGATMEGLPAKWLEIARKHRPELVADPLKQLDPLWREG